MLHDIRILIMLASWLPLCRRVHSLKFSDQKWIGDDELNMQRLGYLMTGIAWRTEERFTELTRIKVALDESSVEQKRAFEKGYVMGEIIETYRKALVYVHKQMEKKKMRLQEQDRVKFLMYIQSAYIKVFHLVHMMHEINPKYETDNSGQIVSSNLNHTDVASYYHSPGFSYTKILNEMREERQIERANKTQREKLNRLLELENEGTVQPGTIKKTTNWWPIAYGWDIDYYW